MQATLNIGIQKRSQKSNQKSDQKNSQKIVALIQSNPNVTIAYMAESLDLSLSGVKKILTKLREDKIISRIGPDKGGQWAVIDKTDS
ncbi:MAG: winged helix-turn-helix transcriptional regulator [Lentisphaeria bacterium]|nr:winged helix-turn-helix transcriptional regulator [Lentisphaeria bacterium]